MLEIFISNQKVDLPSDIQIALTIENPMMLQDRVPTPYSLTFDLPSTPKNLRLFKFPDRIPSYGSSVGVLRKVDCRIIFQAITITTGVLSVDRYDQQIKVSFLGVEISEGVRQSLYSNQMAKYTFPTDNWFVVDFNNPSNFGAKYRQYAIDASKGLDNKTVIAPIRVDNGALDFIHGEFFIEVSGELVSTTIAKNTASMMDTEYFNFYNPETEEFMLRWQPAIPPPVHDAIHASLFPQLRVHHVLESLLGDRLDNNIFSTGELRDLVVPSVYFQNWYARDGWIYIPAYKGMMFENNFGLDNPYFNANSFLPAIAASDFIKQLMRLFCCTLIPSGNRFNIRLNKDIIALPVDANWDGKLIGKPIISTQKKQLYKYGYSSEKEYKLDGAQKTVGSVNDMIIDNITPENGAPTEMVYFINSTGQHYRKKATKNLSPDEGEPDEIEIEYELLNAALGAPIDDGGAETFDATSELSPMPLKPTQYWWDAENTAETHPETDWWCVPYWSGDRAVRPGTANIMFYRGPVNAPHIGHSYPILTPYNVSPDGSTVGNLSLQWEGPHGLLENFHNPFKQWVERDRLKVSGTFLLSPIDLHRLDISAKKNLHGRNFYIERIQVTIRHNRIDPAVVDLIEA